MLCCVVGNGLLRGFIDGVDMTLESGPSSESSAI